jgi:hypothetical protein
MDNILGYELSCKHSYTVGVPKNRFWSIIDMGTKKEYFSLEEVETYLQRTEKRYTIVKILKRSPGHIITFLEKSDKPDKPDWIPNYRHIRIRTVLGVRENMLEINVNKELDLFIN